MRPSNTINSIQLLRAVAVLLVVHCHVVDFQLYTKHIAWQQQFFYLQNFGAVGVDIFFVISGFIITLVSTRYATGSGGGDFFLKRIKRVVPLYWIASFSIAIFSFVYWHKTYTIYSVLTTLVFFPFFNPVPQATPILGQGWTLSFELMFYTITTLALLSRNKKYMVFTALFFCACIVLQHVPGCSNVLTNFCGNGIMLEFIWGAIAGMVYLSARRVGPLVANIIFIAGAAGLAASLVLGYGNISEAYATVNGSLSLQRSFVWGIPAALLVTGLMMKEKIKPLYIPFFWVAIGNASYSIYLIHGFLLHFIYNRHFDITFRGRLPADLQVLFADAFAAAGGYLFYRLVELPLLRWLNRKPQRIAAHTISPGNHR